MKSHFETVVIGAGQAGLAVGHHLARRGRSFVILDANERVGDSWRGRWDSLRVFTPAKYNGLPGMRFPAPSLSFPTKDEVADYMAAYAARFALPVRSKVRVDGVSRDGERFVVMTSEGVLTAGNVVIATGAAHAPRVPEFARELDKSIVQMHSSAYKNPGQLRDGTVLVVGAGNSGAEISFDLAQRHHVLLSGTPAGELPVPHGPAMAALVLPLVRFLGTHVLTVDTPVGRSVLPKMRGTPLIRMKIKDLETAGVERVTRVTGARDGMPLLADGRALDVANVIWCTGFRSDFQWVHLPAAFGSAGQPIQYRGVVAAEPGLYFVGLEHMYAAVSEVLPGVGRDAAYVARHIASRGPLAGGVDAEDRMVGSDPVEVLVR
jgi:putative flavoprotein involved in K+ transport